MRLVQQRHDDYDAPAGPLVSINPLILASGVSHPNPLLHPLTSPASSSLSAASSVNVPASAAPALVQQTHISRPAVIASPLRGSHAVSLSSSFSHHGYSLLPGQDCAEPASTSHATDLTPAAAAADSGAVGAVAVVRLQDQYVAGGFIAASHSGSGSPLPRASTSMSKSMRVPHHKSRWRRRQRRHGVAPSSKGLTEEAWNLLRCVLSPSVQDRECTTEAYTMIACHMQYCNAADTKHKAQQRHYHHRKHCIVNDSHMMAAHLQAILEIVVHCS